jgi:hypothetical protein
MVIATQRFATDARIVACKVAGVGSRMLLFFFNEDIDKQQKSSVKKNPYIFVEKYSSFLWGEICKSKRRSHNLDFFGN